MIDFLLKPLAAATLSLGATLLAAPAAPATPVSALEWKGMLARARSGGVIELGRRPVAVQSAPFQPSARVTIRGGVFAPIVLDRWRNVTFDGARFEGVPGTPSDQSLVVADAAENLTLRNCRFTGYAGSDGALHVRGPSFRNSRNVAIERSTFEDMGGFVGFVRTDGARFNDNDFRRVREGVQVQGGRNIVIERNRFEQFRPASGDHPDAIQFFTTGLNGPGDLATQDVSIRDNLILAEGRAQGIFTNDEIDLAGRGRGFRRFSIERNIIVAAAYHGITTTKIEELVVRGNQLVRSRGSDPLEVRLWIDGGSGTISDNEANQLILGNGTRHEKNRTVQDSDAGRVRTLIAEWSARFRPN